jgi:hypothetical protein
VLRMGEAMKFVTNAHIVCSLHREHLATPPPVVVR